MSRRRVAVTGTSVLTSLGSDVDDVWKRICNGESGISPIERFDSSEFRVRIAGEIKGFDALSHMQIDSKSLRRMDRFVEFALVTAHKAIQQSGLMDSAFDPYRSGVVIGSGIGGLDEIEDQHSRLFDRGPERISAFMIPKLIINSASGNVAVHWGLKGPSSAVATACASAVHAIGNAFRIIQGGYAEVMITGGTEAPITPMGIGGFARMNALSLRNDAPQLASRPFDADRDGFVMSEGAGMLVLEDMEFAKKRGADILAEIVGFGLSTDGLHMTQPDEFGTGAGRAMTAALDDAGLAPDKIDYINAHGTSTSLGDRAETLAIRSVFGSHADAIAVSSTKGHLGHLLGASGGVETVFCVNAIQSQTVPPTINFDSPGDDCDLDYVPNEARDRDVRYTLKNSFAFGGHNACLVLASVS